MIKSYKIKKLFLVCIACIVILSITITNVYALPNENNVYKKPNKTNLNKHVHVLSEEIGVRLMGTTNEKATADYIKNQLDSVGYNAQIKEYNLPSEKSTTVACIKINGKEYYGNYYFDKGIENIENVKINDVSNLDVTENDIEYISNWDIKQGDTVIVNYGLFVKLEKLVSNNDSVPPEYNNLKAEDFINKAIQKSYENKAETLIIYNDNSTRSLSLRNIDNDKLPVITTDMNLGKLIISSEESLITIDDFNRSISWNVVAVKESKSKNPSAIIHVTAHMDSVMGAPGATDNASSIAALIELANIYKDVDTDDIEIRFVAFGGEEGGLNGSKAYVKSLTENEAQVSINYNMDMLSTSWNSADAISLDISQGIDNKEATFNIAAAMIIGGSKNIELIDGTKNIRWYKYGASDHESFQKRGIDAASMIRTTDETDDIEPVNHTINDSMKENYSLERLEECTNIMSNGIKTALVNQFSKILEYDIKDNKIIIANAKQLSNLFNEIEFTFKDKNGNMNSVSAYKENNFVAMIPDDVEIVSVYAIGDGNANLKGTFNRNKIEKYYSKMVAKKIEITESVIDEEKNVDKIDNSEKIKNTSSNSPETSDNCNISALIYICFCAIILILLIMKTNIKKN